MNLMASTLLHYTVLNECCCDFCSSFCTTICFAVFIDSAFLARQKTKADADFYTAQRAAEANKVNS